MAGKNLKGLTIKIGGDTSELTKALDGVEKQSRNLSSELGQINKLLKLDPKNTELLAQKQKVLAEAISNTEKKLDTLREAEKQVQAQFERGEVSEAQYRALQREIIETEKKLGKYEKAAKDTADEVEKLGKESKNAATGIGMTEQEAKEAQEALDDLGASAADAAKTGLTALVGAATAAVGAIVATAEASREYRTEMGKLETAFSDAGHSTEAATKTYEALQGVLGETDQAVEAANHLAKLCDTEEELADWTEIATGVYATFGASLPIEGLTEAANETAKVGTLTGSLADALNWAGVSEDEFQESLDACSSEQERQQLITKTLTKLYKNAATQYKTTNKEVIRANEANEKWNKTLAKVGKAVEPVVTDVKELGAALLEDASEPLEDLAKFIQKEVLPAIKDIATWTKRNLPAIATGVAGVTAALVAHKVATIAAELASKGWTIATLAQAAAQKVLNAVMAAGPWGLVATAVAGVTAALIALKIATKDAEKPVDTLTKEERELMAAADEAAKAFKDQKKATDEALGGITSEMSHVQSLADELHRLADSQGRVAKGDQSRARFILNELNDALGTEYKLVCGVIQQYDTLEASINDVIKAKTANALVEAANADYVTAIQNEAAALENMNLKHEDYRAQLERTQTAEEAWIEADAEYVEAKKSGNAIWIENAALAAEAAETAYQKEKGILDEKKTAYEQAAQDYSGYYNTIATYEEAQAAVLEGNYQKAVDLLAKKGGAYGTYSDKVDTETAKVLDTLYKEAVDAGLEAQRTKENFEKGVDGYTKEMVAEAEKGYEKALEEFATAYADAEGVGEDLGEGMTAGAENKRSSLLAKARSLVAGFLSAARDEADSHSPSRKAIKVFEDVGEGAAVGIENKTDDVKVAARNQAAAVLDEYRWQEADAQKSLLSVAEQQTSRHAANQMAAATANSSMLDKILSAIEKGQVLLLDGEAMVGGTAERMNKKLGMMHVLSARGAK
jgi:phage-related minor tail protein